MAQDPLCLLCVETRFPGRLGGVADWLVRHRGYRCQFFCHQYDPPEHWPEAAGKGLDVIQFNVGGVAREPAVPWNRNLERGLCHAYGAWEVIDSRRPRPIDIVLGRSAGLGSSLFAPVSLPHAPVVNFFDYYVHPGSGDLAEDDRAALPTEYTHWRRSANAMDLLDLENGVVPWTATAWQRDLYPPEYRQDFVVLHDGVDARRFARRSSPARARTVAGRTIPAGTKVVSFVARTLDRLRGFDRFLTLAARLQRARPDVLCIAAGLTSVSRMLDLRHYGQDYAARLVAESPLPDASRFWSLGLVGPATIAELFAATELHVVPSRIYSAQRSLVEAMAAGALVLAWDTPPVRELLDADRTGLLVSSDDDEGAARAALAALADPAAFRPLTSAAVETVREQFDRDATLPRLVSLFDRLVSSTSSVANPFP
jgi:glycosyltransferase involved in cell wall biosynthesis